MVDDIIGLFMAALVVGVVALAIRNASGTSNILNTGLTGFTNLEHVALNG